MLPNADHIIALEHGAIKYQGVMAELKAQGFDLTQFQKELSSAQSDGDGVIADNTDKIKEDNLRQSGKGLSEKDKGPNGNKNGRKLIENESRETGAIKLKTYLSYGRAMGAFSALFVLLILVLSQLATVVSQYWLGEWTSQQQNGTANMSDLNALADVHRRTMNYLSVYAAISLSTVASKTLRRPVRRSFDPLQPSSLRMSSCTLQRLARLVDCMENL